MIKITFPELKIFAYQHLKHIVAIPSKQSGESFSTDFSFTQRGLDEKNNYLNLSILYYARG
ncbi:MAG: hypothetical protein QME59_04630 [Candidatus Hydrothermarchaeota archaeon]|nr:hypothetical protein [Candidatus Hydrothermarchaeota archaeon]